MSEALDAQTTVQDPPIPAHVAGLTPIAGSSPQISAYDRPAAPSPRSGLAAGSLELTARRAALPAPVPVLMVLVQLCNHYALHRDAPQSPVAADSLCAN